jgi:peptidoglycan/xylan/chitin deacetylase (PgdA/CDA1 family)
MLNTNQNLLLWVAFMSTKLSSFFTVILLASSSLITGASLANETELVWPNQYKAAVSLSYDDGLYSQIKNAIPELDKHNIKASFYLTLSSPAVDEYMELWRSAANNGHELGNHTLYHPCRGSLPNREWVNPLHDTDKKTVAEMVEQVTLANTMLKAIDGKTIRTFTVPCDDLVASDGNYVEKVRSKFVAIKANNPSLAKKYDLLFMPENVTGKQLINFVKSAEKQGGIANILFHGIGGDHLSVSVKAHAELLQFLADNKDKYWTDTYINIMQYVMRND